MVGTRAGFGSDGVDGADGDGARTAPSSAFVGEGTLLVVGDRVLAGGDAGLGGSEYLARFGGTDRFPTLPERPAALVDALATVADSEGTLAVHDASHGGLAVTLAEMVTDGAGATVALDAADASPSELLFHEQAGRAVVETTDPDAVRAAFEGVAPVAEVGRADDSGALSVTVGDASLRADAATIRDLRSVLDEALA
jgi:phosphoribosylformylglycinamidine synthase